MSNRSIRRQAYGLAGGFLLTLTAAGVAQAQQATVQAPFWGALMLETAAQDDVWQRMRDNFQWQIDSHEPRVQKWITYYRQHAGSVAAIAEQARPWLHWIVSEIERHDMPAEIALLPFIESAYDPAARHVTSGATGMWQFMPGTGDALGLRRNRWYDGRRDVVASTRAALDYLRAQADQWYEGDIELSLAAYNAGAGTVNKAVRAAVARGKPGDYWHLKLPNETMNYVPKLLALSRIIAEPERYGVALPSIPDQPVFARVPVEGQVDLAQVADLANVSRTQLAELNPGLLQGSTLPERSPQLLVPYEAKDALTEALTRRSDAIDRWDSYQVRRGDTLSALAARYAVPISVLRQHNGLSSNMLRIGQRLRIPLNGRSGETQQDRQVVQVRAGDSLSGIAARHDVSTADIRRWNRLNAGQYLQPGQQLTLYAK